MQTLKIFSELKKRYEVFIKARRALISKGNSILSFSKQAIFAYQRGQIKEGDIFLKKAEKILKDVDKKFIKKDPSLLLEGSLKSAQEEFVEAFLLQKIIQRKPLTPITGFNVNLESYFGGLCDVIGEISRYSVNLASSGEEKSVLYFRQQAENIMKELVKFNFTGYLRTKYDQAKNSFKKIEEVYYDIKIKRR